MWRFAISALLCGLSPAAAFAADDLAAPPAYAPPVWFGEVEINGGKTDLGGDAVNVGGCCEAEYFWFSGGALRTGLNFGDGWMVQGDLFAERTNVGSFSDSYDMGLGAAGHFAYRNDIGLLGVFGGYLHTDQDDDDTDITERYFVGLDGQYFMPNLTLYGQVGWLDGETGSDDGGQDSLRETTFVRGVARWFLTDDTRVDFSGAWAQGIMDDDADSGNPPDDDFDGYNYGVGIEQRWGSTNWSVFAGYEFGRYHQDDPTSSSDTETVTEHTWKFAVKYRFGGTSTLKEADRYGASLDVPSVLRWSALSGGPLE